MKRCFSLGSAAILSLTLLAGTPSFGKGSHGGGHSTGHAHSGGSGHSAGHSSGHAHSSGHSGGAHHASGHPAPSHSAPHPQLTHNPSTHPQHSPLHPAHPQPAHNPPTPLHTFGQAAAPNATVNNSGTNSGGGWHHGHHSEWNTWADGAGLPGYYNPYWNGDPGVVVVPAENVIIEQQYVTRVAPPPAPQSRSQNSDDSDPSQTNPAP